VLAWIFDRCEGNVGANGTPIGLLPHQRDLNVAGLEIDATALEELLTGNASAWRKEVPLIEQHFALFGERLPDELHDHLTALRKRLE
jgi:phosphoenolpyruvate carboxykinase (GTP)